MHTAANAIDDRIRYASSVDLFSTESLLNPYADYRTLRDLGPIAYMTCHETWVVTRYDAVKRVLREPQTFSSAQGIGFNPVQNKAWEGLLPTIDKPAHTPLRKVYDDSLRPAAISQYSAGIERQAERFVDAMLEKREFDAISDCAEVLPVSIMADLVGFPDDGRRKHLIHWATDSYNCCGPLGKFDASLTNMQQLYAYVVEISNPDTIKGDTFAGHALAAVARGEITQQEAMGIIGGYATASLDTTANAVGNLLLLLAQNPEQWALVRDEPELAMSTVREASRVETPAQWFTRVTTHEVQFGDITIPVGTRLIHSYGAANRDERRFPNPDRFDARRNPTDSLAFGHGVHTCPGQHISNLETRSLLTAMTRRIARLELTGEPVRRLNNLTRGLKSLPVRVHPR